MSWLTPTRVESEELLDEHDAPEQDMLRSLDDLRRINRYLGGISIYRRMLNRLVPDADQPLTVLDLGTGTSDLLEGLNRPGLLPVGLDFKFQHLLYGKSLGARTRRVGGDAFRLPFASGSVDVVTSAHFFHHFSSDENVRILEEALRVARVGVAVNDTRRHHLPLLFTRIIGALGIVGRITKFDAPASVLQGYTLREAREIADRVKARRAEVVRAFPFRFGLLLWK